MTYRCGALKISFLKTDLHTICIVASTGKSKCGRESYITIRDDGYRRCCRNRNKVCSASHRMLPGVVGASITNERTLDPVSNNIPKQIVWFRTLDSM